MTSSSSGDVASCAPTLQVALAYARNARSHGADPPLGSSQVDLDRLQRRPFVGSGYFEVPVAGESHHLLNLEGLRTGHLARPDARRYANWVRELKMENQAISCRARISSFWDGYEEFSAPYSVKLDLPNPPTEMERGAGNAVCHRDDRWSAPIQVIRCSDRIENRKADHALVDEEELGVTRSAYRTLGSQHARTRGEAPPRRAPDAEAGRSPARVSPGHPWPVDGGRGRRASAALAGGPRFRNWPGVTPVHRRNARWKARASENPSR